MRETEDTKKTKKQGDNNKKKNYTLSMEFFIDTAEIDDIKTLNDRKKIVLSQSAKTSILIPPKYWCTVKFVSKNSILMVVCDHYYDPKDQKKYLSCAS